MCCWARGRGVLLFERSLRVEYGFLECRVLSSGCQLPAENRCSWRAAATLNTVCHVGGRLFKLRTLCYATQHALSVRSGRTGGLSLAGLLGRRRLEKSGLDWMYDQDDRYLQLGPGCWNAGDREVGPSCTNMKGIALLTLFLGLYQMCDLSQWLMLTGCWHETASEEGERGKQRELRKCHKRSSRFYIEVCEWRRAVWWLAYIKQGSSSQTELPRVTGGPQKTAECLHSNSQMKDTRSDI